MNNYHIYEEIGKGKYSVVYKGRKKKSIEYVAVKSLEKSRRKKLMNEVKMFSDLNHQSILRFMNWYETRNHIWAITEYCPGGDLMGLIEADSTGLNESTTKQFIKELASGLMYLHHRGIIYCDLKPSNVLFNEYGNVKISDLGLAKRLVDLITSTATPEEREQLSKRGSPYYMAPELFQDGGVYSFQSDMWALGCVAYELATGQPPFASNSFQELVNQILHADFAKIENYSPQFNEFIRGLLDKDPTKRWTWDRVCKHSLFKLQVLSIPSQPHFDNWCKKNQRPPEPNDKNLVLSTPLYQQVSKAASNQGGVDILRLSLNVKKNMLREEAQPYQTNAKTPPPRETTRDVKLVDKDQEIHIGAADDEDDAEADEGSSEEVVLPAQQFMNSASPNSSKPQSNKENLHPKQVGQSKIEPMGSQSPIIPSGGHTPLLKKAESTSQQMVPLDQLFTHSSDSSVKPIIGNREIEKSAQDQIVLKEQLPFQYIPPEDVNKGIESEAIEQHFENIYNVLSSSTVSQNDKLNVINYFEQIIQSSGSANRLLNSAFTPLLLKLAKQSKTPQFKLRICCVVGLLIRHATVIDPEVSQVGIVEGMVEILNSKETAQVRRKACAALGEYLFYGATQMDEDPTNQYWDVTTLSFTTLLKLIKNSSEDLTVKFYAVKTIENISSQSISTGYKFATQEVFSVLINQFLVTKNDNLKVSCVVSIANLVLLDNNQVELALYGIGLKNIVQFWLDGHQRVQQALITIFNMYLLQSLSNNNDSNGQSPLSQATSKSSSIQQAAVSTVNKLIMEESNIFQALIALLNHGSQVTRGKAALSLMLIIKFNVNTLISLSEESLRFYVVLEKCLRESNDYLKSCLSHLVQQLRESTPWMMQAISDEISRLSQTDKTSEEATSKRKPVRKGSNINEATKLYGNLAFINVLNQFAQAPSIQPAIFNSQYLPVLTTLLNASTPNVANPLLSTVQQHLFNIVSQVTTNSKILVKQQETVIHGVLKPCIDCLGSNTVIETKFLFLKLIIEMAAALLSEESIYDYPDFLKQQAPEINRLVINQLMPQIRILLVEQPPLPAYALKLVAVLLEHNQQFLPHMKKHKIIQVLVDTYKIDNNFANGNTLLIIQQICEGRPLDEIGDQIDLQKFKGRNK